jgi:hypothetical protein
MVIETVVSPETEFSPSEHDAATNPTKASIKKKYFFIAVKIYIGIPSSLGIPF